MSVATPLPERVTLKYVWQTLKDYFGDGYVPGSAPFTFNVHLCQTERLPENENIHYGINIDEDAMALFGCLGESVKPPCTCNDMAALITHIDAFVERTSDDVPDAYKVFSRKNEATANESCTYGMRDTLQWWVQWHGSLDKKHYWKHLYVGFGTACDDVLIPPQHLIDGRFRMLGHTAKEVIDGMHSEGVSAEDCVYMEMCVWRQYLAQYIEKVDPELRNYLVERTHVMSQFRVIGANTHGCAAAVLVARGVPFKGRAIPGDAAIEMASYGDALSMDLAKEALGLLQGEPTETTAGRNRAKLKAELRWMQARIMEQLDQSELAPYLRRYSTAGLHFVLLNDRYQERLGGMKRRRFTPQMEALINSYKTRDGRSVPEGIDDRGHAEPQVLVSSSESDTDTGKEEAKSVPAPSPKKGLRAKLRALFCA